MASINNIRKQLDDSLHDASKPWTSVLTTLESKSGINRSYLFIGMHKSIGFGFFLHIFCTVGIIAFVGLWLAFGYAAQLLCNTVGFLYPAYVSIHALESPTKEDDTKWLTYWVVFAVFSVVEYFADTIVGWFPLYWLAKVQ